MKWKNSWKDTNQSMKYWVSIIIFKYQKKRSEEIRDICFIYKIYWYIKNHLKRHECLLNVYYYVQKANLKRLHMSPSIWHSGKAKTVEIIKRSVVVRGWVWGVGWIGGAHRIFRVVKILCILYGGHIIIHLFKPIKT